MPDGEHVGAEWRWFAIAVDTQRKAAPTDGIGRVLCRKAETFAPLLAEKGLADRDFEFFLPLLVEKLPCRSRDDRRSRGVRWHRVVQPLFPGYLFLRAPLGKIEWHRIFEAPAILGVVSAGAEPLPALPGAVEDLRAKALEGDGTLWRHSDGSWRPGPIGRAAPRPNPFKVGDAVRVTEGPFTSFEGTYREPLVEAHKIWVDIFGRATVVELPEDAFVRA